MPIKKKITTFNLDEAIVKEFDSFCAANEKSRSKVANNIFKNFMESKKTKKRGYNGKSNKQKAKK